MTIKIVENKITRAELRRIAKEIYGDMVKCTADIEKKIMAIGGAMHIDSNELLIRTGSKQSDVWGFNIYPDLEEDDWLVFNSLINIKPTLGNRSANIMDKDVHLKIRAIVQQHIV